MSEGTRVVMARQYGASGQAGLGVRWSRRVLLATLIVTLAAAAVVPNPASASGWSVIRSANAVGARNGVLDGVSCTSAASCVSVGHYVNGSGTEVALAEQWNGTSWEVQSVPRPSGAIRSGLSAVSCTMASACTAVGDYVNRSGVVETLAERWNGTAWSIQTTVNPSAGGSLAGVSCLSGGCTAVGQSGGGTLAESWNGSAWSINPTPSGEGPLLAVSCTALNACMAVGQSGSGALAEQWNGSTWTVQPLPAPVTGHVVLSAVLSGVSCTASSCIAVGRDVYEICNNGQATCNCVQSPGCRIVHAALTEQWNGSAWIVQSSPATPGGNGLAGVACTAANSCVAVGPALSGGTAVAEIWNGSNWTLESTPSVTGGASLDAVSCVSGECTATGQGNTATLAESWNGTTWTLQSTPTPVGAYVSVLYGVSCPAATSCTAVGHYVSASGADLTLAEQWNGSTWTRQAAPTPAGTVGLSSVSCPASTACTAVGPGPGIGAAQAEQWNGTTWTSDSTPTGAQQSLSGVSCSAAAMCTAVGHYFNGTINVTLAERWDGTSWSAEPTPNPTGSLDSAFLYSVSCSTSASCMAVGEDNDPSDVTLAEVWDGTTWSIVPTPNPAGETVRSDLLSVSCTAPDACTAVGFGQNTSVGLAERWNGSVWTINPTPNPGGPAVLDSVSCTSATACTAVGYYRNGTQNVALAEQWNGTSWSITPTPTLVASTYSVLSGVSCPTPTSCIAVGDYVNASGTDVTLAESYSG